ncbi:MAG TPA: hypothetical protein VK728_05360 [Candidatus Sulfotelmatobacter sp.]|jgi:hypothetical protein|nr:hypothetical protein [Candidatus Sulfotelmatobacter sp.]
MPSYGNLVPPVSVGFGDSAAVIASTDVVFPAPFKSAQVALAPAFSSGKVRAAVEIVWSGAPGVISVQLQTADTDIDAAYIQEGAAITNVNSGNVTRAEFPDVVAKFARILIATLPNNVTATAKISA